MLRRCCRGEIFRSSRCPVGHGPAAPLAAHSASGKELGLRLFERTSRSVALTQGGALLLDEARALLACTDTFLAGAARIRDGRSGLLQAALPSGIVGEPVASILAGLRKDQPGLEVELHELSTAEQLARMAAHELDAGVIHHPCDTTGLELGPVLRRELGVLLPPASPLAVWERFVIARETVAEVLAESPGNVEVPPAVVVGGVPEPVVGGVPGSVVPMWREGLAAEVLAPDYRQLVDVLAGGSVSVVGAMDCRQLAVAVGLEPVPAKVEGLRSKVKRLAARGWLAEERPGMFSAVAGRGGGS